MTQPRFMQTSILKPCRSAEFHCTVIFTPGILPCDFFLEQRQWSGKKALPAMDWFKKTTSKAAGSAEPKHTLFGVLRLHARRERCCWSFSAPASDVQARG